MTSAREVLADNLLDIEDHIGLVRTAKQEADRLLTALESAGFAIVPVEPTKRMIETGNNKVSEATWIDGYESSGHYVEIDPTCARDTYRAMLSAAKDGG